MRGTFRHASGFQVEIEAKGEDLHLLPEITVRKAFIEEATRRLGTVILGEWTLLEVVDR